MKTRKGQHARIVLAPAPHGVWMIFMGMPVLPARPVRWMTSMDDARSMAIAYHMSHGWSIEEQNEPTCDCPECVALGLA